MKREPTQQDLDRLWLDFDRLLAGERVQGPVVISGEWERRNVKPQTPAQRKEQRVVDVVFFLMLFSMLVLAVGAVWMFTQGNYPFCFTLAFMSLGCAVGLRLLVR